MFDLAQIRADTPGLQHSLFFDNAGSSLPPTRVVDTVISHVRREAEIGGYRAAYEAEERLWQVKMSIAHLIGARAEDIAMMESASRAWNEFFSGLAFSRGDRILTCRTDYPSNAINALKAAREVGALVEVIPSDEYGRVDCDALRNTIDERVKLVSLVEVPTNCGTINPVQEIVQIAHEHGAVVLHDACQSVGQLPINVSESGVDALSATGRKWLRGPRGTGFLYVNPNTASGIEPKMLGTATTTWSSPQEYEVSEDARRFEYWEGNIAGILGLGTAVEYLIDIGCDQAYEEVQRRARELREGLAGIARVTVSDPGWECRGEKEVPLSGIVTFIPAGISVDDLYRCLVEKNVSCHYSRRSSAQHDMSARGLHDVVRVSPHYFTSAEDIERLVSAIDDIVRHN